MIQAQVVRLATDIDKYGRTENCLCMDNTGKLCIIVYEKHNVGGDLFAPQYMYLTTNEKIQEGDWVIKVRDENGNLSKDIKPIHLLVGFGLLLSNSRGMRDYDKIVASTNLVLKLPSIPQQFLEDYVKANGNISSVWLEQEDKGRYRAGKHDNPDIGDEWITNWQLKLSEKEEVVIVDKKPKNSYTPQFDDQSICFNRTDKEWAEVVGEDPVQIDKDKELETLSKKCADDYRDGTGIKVWNGVVHGYVKGYKAAEEKASKDVVDFLISLETQDWIPAYVKGNWINKTTGAVVGIPKLWELWKNK